MSGDICYGHDWGGQRGILLVFSGYSREMPLKTLQCIGQPFTIKSNLVPNVSGAEIEKQV